MEQEYPPYLQAFTKYVVALMGDQRIRRFPITDSETRERKPPVVIDGFPFTLSRNQEFPLRQTTEIDNVVNGMIYAQLMQSNGLDEKVQGPKPELQAIPVLGGLQYAFGPRTDSIILSSEALIQFWEIIGKHEEYGVLTSPDELIQKDRVELHNKFKWGMGTLHLDYQYMSDQIMHLQGLTMLPEYALVAFAMHQSAKNDLSLPYSDRYRIGIEEFFEERERYPSLAEIDGEKFKHDHMGIGVLRQLARKTRLYRWMSVVASVYSESVLLEKLPRMAIHSGEEQEDLVVDVLRNIAKDKDRKKLLEFGRDVIIQAIGRNEDAFGLIPV